MAFTPRPGSGSLFRNDKNGNERAPDYKGDLCLLDGEVVKIAGWLKDGQRGKFLSISIDRPREQQPSQDDFRAPARSGGSAPLAGGGGSRGGQTGRFDPNDLDDPLPF